LCNVQHARDIALIISGRYPVFLVDLTSAENYSPNLIDNLCCVDWSIPPEQVIPIRIYEYSRVVVEAKKLVYCQNQNLELAKEQQYLQMVWYCVRLFDKLVDQQTIFHTIFGYDIKHFMSFVFDQQDQDYINLQNIKKQIFRELFLGRDLESVGASLENIFAKIEQKS
jgi:hypothetical protein